MKARVKLNYKQAKMQPLICCPTGRWCCFSLVRRKIMKIVYRNTLIGVLWGKAGMQGCSSVRSNWLLKRSQDEMQHFLPTAVWWSLMAKLNEQRRYKNPFPVPLNPFSCLKVYLPSTNFLTQTLVCPESVLKNIQWLYWASRKSKQTIWKPQEEVSCSQQLKT